MKPFYVVSALVETSSQLGKLQRHVTENSAIEHAKSIIERRRIEGQPEMDFHILKVVAMVGVQRAPIKVTRVRSK